MTPGTAECPRIVRTSPQLIVFSYHKSGTSMLLHVMTKVSERLGLTLVNQFGLADRIPADPDIILLPHALLSQSSLADLTDRPYRAIRMVRDPRDIWISGYLYHRHCGEAWCTNTDLDARPPIGWPQVDYSFAHRPEGWKRDYLDRLQGKSYQQRLLDSAVADGLNFELEGYTGCTLATLREWPSYGLQVMDVKLEAVMADFDGAMLQIFGYFGFTAEQSLLALDVARSEDIRRMDEAALALRPQIHSRLLSKWSDVLSSAQVAGFEASYGDLIVELGYELADVPADTRVQLISNTWVTRADEPLGTEQLFNVDADEDSLIWPSPETASIQRGDIWLTADGAIIRPMLGLRGTYRFVVPPGAQRVCLVSCRGVPVDMRAPYLDAGRCLGVRVSAIAIRSRTGEVVIPADDPRLVTGWHDVEQSGRMLWRWTAGSAELPWAGVAGPAMVTVLCRSPGEVADRDEIGSLA